MNNPKSENLVENLPFAEIEVTDTNNHSSLLIKHNYYSSDSKHGQYLLDQYMNSLINGDLYIEAIYLIDSAVKLLDSNLHSRDLLIELSESNNCTIYAASESIDEYGISFSDSCLCELFEATNIFAEIQLANNLIVIE